jgi:hypothetical protein
MRALAAATSRSTLSCGLRRIAKASFHRTGTFLLSLHLIFEKELSSGSPGAQPIFSADEKREHEGSQETALSVFVACDKRADDTDQNKTVWVGVPLTAPEAFHMDTLLRSSQMIVDGNISPDSVQYAVCVGWKGDWNWTARLPAQKQEVEWEALLSPIQRGS